MPWETLVIYVPLQNKLDDYNEPYKTYIRIIENMPGMSITNFNSVLKKSGLAQLGTNLREGEQRAEMCDELL